MIQTVVKRRAKSHEPLNEPLGGDKTVSVYAFGSIKMRVVVPQIARLIPEHGTQQIFLPKIVETGTKIYGQNDFTSFRMFRLGSKKFRVFRQVSNKTEIVGVSIKRGQIAVIRGVNLLTLVTINKKTETVVVASAQMFHQLAGTIDAICNTTDAICEKLISKDGSNGDEVSQIGVFFCGAMSFNGVSLFDIVREQFLERGVPLANVHGNASGPSVTGFEDRKTVVVFNHD
ncbi:MAG: hypothetical protein AAB505_03040 [Patescibacteria group bacterium]